MGPGDRTARKRPSTDETRGQQSSVLPKDIPTKNLDETEHPLLVALKEKMPNRQRTHYHYTKETYFEPH
jgi:hypothetical protein